MQASGNELADELAKAGTIQEIGPAPWHYEPVSFFKQNSLFEILLKQTDY
jgi:hypothetical protein